LQEQQSYEQALAQCDDWISHQVLNKDGPNPFNWSVQHAQKSKKVSKIRGARGERGGGGSRIEPRSPKGSANNQKLARVQCEEPEVGGPFDLHSESSDGVLIVQDWECDEALPICRSMAARRMFVDACSEPELEVIAFLLMDWASMPCGMTYLPPALAIFGGFTSSSGHSVLAGCHLSSRACLCTLKRACVVGVSLNVLSAFVFV
jgi:hypothetical protein